MRNQAAWLAIAAVLLSAAPRAQDSAAIDARRKALDDILDMDVRDGYVYYRALKTDRGKLDRYVAQIATADVNALDREEQIAFWLNAYNALVLKTVIDHYPIMGHAAGYPSKSIRQVPGAFERTAHMIAGRMVTLDDIEKQTLAGYHDPRLFFAIGRGAVGGGRLRSEAFTGAMLEQQLAQVAAECASRTQCVEVNRAAGTVSASPVFSWEEQEFVAGYAGKAPPVFASRSPIERAILGFVEPKLLTTERDFLDMNTFRVAFHTFDWTLNDLTGRGGR